jgi:hypothetical protein
MTKFQVGIRFEGRDGWIQYDEEKREFEAEHPDKIVVKSVMTYLTTPREFRIPESDRLDDYRIEEMLPGESKMHAQLSLSELFGKTGVLVLWDKGNFGS